MKACHCQAGLEWVNVINFLFCDPRPRRSPKMWNSLCFGKSYFGLMQQEQVADMERRFCIRLDAKLTLIKLPLDADALVVILQTHKDTRRQKMQNVAVWFRLDSSWFWHGWEQVVWRPSWKAAFAIPTHNFAIFANFAIPTHNWQETHTWKSLVSNVSNILWSSSSPSPSLSSWPKGSVFYWWLRRDQFQPAQHFHITRLYFARIYEIGKPWFGILRLAQLVAKPPSLTHCCHKKRCRNIE